MERINADLRQHGLDVAEWEILVNLSEVEGRRMRMSDLADSVHQSRSRLTHTITRMEKSDLVKRTSCPEDRRGVWAELTDEGMALIVRAAPSHVETVRQNFVDAMSTEDYAAIGRAFAAVIEADSNSGLRTRWPLPSFRSCRTPLRCPTRSPS